VESKGLLFIRKFSLPDELSYVHSDKEKLYSIFANLINNAIKFTPKGYVELFCTLTDTRFELYVKDTGIGIPQDKHRIIFERFIQADVSHQRPYEGSGLGLSITKAYVEMLDGNIWLESQEGKGSTFFVSLPMKQALSTDEEELRIRQIISDAGFSV
ncbi:MAG: ATP-binding protein, partial [Bacteroidota bacterium]|nr:ATP-binding protein [Bacteroidota bacterium]